MSYIMMNYWKPYGNIKEKLKEGNGGKRGDRGIFLKFGIHL
jgi:hypothetical protein